MTTIAWDSEYLAADSRVTHESKLISNNFYKIRQFSKGTKYNGDTLLYIAMSGHLEDFEKVLDMIKHEEFPSLSFKISHEVSALILGKNYIYELEANGCYLIRYNHSEKLALGSGGNFALSAMYLGLNATEAVQHASLLDLATNDNVISVRVI